MKSIFRPLIIFLSALLLMVAIPGLAQDEAGAESLAESGSNPKAVIHTSLGEITLELFSDDAPV